MAVEAPRRDAPGFKIKRQAIRKRVRPWHRVTNIAGKSWSHNASENPADKFAKYNVQVNAPAYTDDVYENNLQSSEWTREDTDILVALFKECAGKWPVVVDHWPSTSTSTPDRPLEQLKKRFYDISAAVMELETPRASMTSSDFEHFTTLQSYDSSRDTHRRQLAEGHMQRRQSEVDEESVLLAELQKIMANQAQVDSEREELRRRLDYPHANGNAYQYSTSHALTGLWQQLLAADRMRKNQRLKPLPTDLPQGATRDRGSIAQSVPDSATRERHQSSQQQTGENLSAADKERFGVSQPQEKLPSGVTFASDKLTKPRIAKSTIQTDKIAAILSHIGIPEVIPLPTPLVVENFEALMAKVHTLLDMRKLAEKEEQEIRTREAELNTEG